MLISRKWLSDWVDLKNLSNEELVEKLSVSGLEVASVTDFGKDQDLIVVGQIDAIEPHPKADRLVVCKVDVGELNDDGSKDLKTIVCGAKNMVAKDYVPVALPNSSPPGLDFDIVTRKVMGVVSEGMLCAKEELGLEESSEGLWILPSELAAKHIGKPIFKALEIEDTVFEIEVTPNRPDALCHYGVAKEIAALFSLEVRSFEDRLARLPKGSFSGGENLSQASKESISVKITSKKPVRYAVSKFNSIEVHPSPLWLELYLLKTGNRPVNQVVDLTNFIMLDLNQPLHAFDQEVATDHIVVVDADFKEPWVGINHKRYNLTQDDILISNQQYSGLALAGVMGGESSEVSDSTASIMLECAYFCPTSVRKTSKRLAIHSEASHRYERGLSAEDVDGNLKKTIDLMAHLFGVKLDRDNYVIDSNFDIEPVIIDFPLAEYKRIIGLPIELKTAKSILHVLGFEVLSESTDEVGDRLEIRVPGNRPDVTRPIDIVEELVRVVGINEIPSRLHLWVSSEMHAPRTDRKEGLPTTLVSQKRLTWQQDLRSALLLNGFAEQITYSFICDDDLASISVPESDPLRVDVVTLSNPLTVERSVMRTTLLPNFLQVVAQNRARHQHDLAFFEIGRCYQRESRQETKKLAIFAMGEIENHFSNHGSWDFFTLKGFLQDLFSKHDVELAFRLPEVLHPYLHPGIQADIFLETSSGSTKVGYLGRLHPTVLDDQRGEGGFYAELTLEPLFEAEESVPKATLQSKFQPVQRDFAFLVPKELGWEAIEKGIYEASKGNPKLAIDFKSCRLFDVYQGEQIAADHRSIAVTVIYQSAEETLTDEILATYDKVLLEGIEKDLGLTLRT